MLSSFAFLPFLLDIIRIDVLLSAIHQMLTYLTFSNYDKYIFLFEEIHLAAWKNTTSYLKKFILRLRDMHIFLKKYILQLGQIHFLIWRNTFCDLDKYILIWLCDRVGKLDSSCDWSISGWVHLAIETNTFSYFKKDISRLGRNTLCSGYVRGLASRSPAVTEASVPPLASARPSPA